MKFTHPFTCSVAFVLLQAACGGAGQVAPTPAPAEPTLAGVWQSECIDPGNGQAFRLVFDLKTTDWTLDYTAFGDARCEAANLTVHIEGPYTLGAASKRVEGAREGEFGFARKSVTPHNDGAAGFLPQACGGGNFAVGVPTDITAGCPGLGAYPIEKCGTDHDIVHFKGNVLRFGARPADNDMCSLEKRPTALGAPLTRKQ
ncbi:MAG: hypothetical protein ACOYM9_05330 [Bradymonadia bacterium]|jgi:hypothetical protein